MQKYVFLAPFNFGGKEISSQADLDRVWIDPTHADRLANPKQTSKQEPVIRVVIENEYGPAQVTNKGAKLEGKK